MAERKTIPLFSSYINRDYSDVLAKAQYMENLFPIVTTNPISSKSTVVIRKRPGMGSENATVGSGQVGSTIWRSNSGSAPPVVFSFTTGGTVVFYSVVGTYQASYTQVGGAIANANACGGITETLVSGVGNLVASVTDSGSGLNEYWYFPEGGAWTQITNGNFPLNQGTPLQIVGYPVYMDGYMFVMCKNGQIWNSDLNSLANWSATSFITAGDYPDTGVGLAKYRDMIVAVGNGSIEFFRNAGNPSGSPLQRISGMSLKIGARSPGSAYSGPFNYIEADGTIYWRGAEQGTGRIAIWKLNGGQPEKVSPPAIDILLNDANANSLGGVEVLGFLGTMNLHGMRHLVFANSNSGSAINAYWCYCIDINSWWVISFNTNLLVNPISTIIGNEGSTFVIPGTLAKQFRFLYSLFQDDGNAYTATFQTAPLDEPSTNRKFVNRLRIIGDTQSSTSNLAVSYSDDDQVTYSTARNIDLSALNKELTRLGSHRYRRSWKFTHAANTDCRLQAFELERDTGTS